MERKLLNIIPEKSEKAALPEPFGFSAVGLEHGHIYGMTRALEQAGAQLRYVWDEDPEKVEAFRRAFPEVRIARSEEETLADAQTRLIAAAAVPSERCALGIRAMEAGKDYFTDKAPMTALAQLERAREAVRRTGRKYMVYYSERIHSEASVLAGYLVQAGEIGRVIHVEGFGPHRLGSGSRPAWFFEKARYGGILCDIGSHQIEQFLFYTGERAAHVDAARTANYAHPETPELEDFGDCLLTGEGGATGYHRVDWFTPDGLSSWGDGRLFLTGTQGTIELRKNVDVARGGGDKLLLVNGSGETEIDARGKTGYPFFRQLLLDCLCRTETAMTQEHAFLAAELSLRAQRAAERDIIRKGGRSGL